MEPLRCQWRRGIRRRTRVALRFCFTRTGLGADVGSAPFLCPRLPPLKPISLPCGRVSAVRGCSGRASWAAQWRAGCCSSGKRRATKSPRPAGRLPGRRGRRFSNGSPVLRVGRKSRFAIGFTLRRFAAVSRASVRTEATGCRHPTRSPGAPIGWAGNSSCVRQVLQKWIGGKRVW